MTRRTKVVATLGPACSDPQVLEQVLRAGADVCRLNLSHGPLDVHLGWLAEVRRASARLGRRVAVMADLPGPKIRAGAFPDGGVALPPGDPVRLVAGDGSSSADRIVVGYSSLVENAEVGERVVIGDGEITMRVIAVADDGLVAEIESGGHAQGRPGVHLGRARLTLHAPTADDLRLAEAVAEAGADYLALSFVRYASEIEELREVVGDRVRIVAKIETSAALGELTEISAAADAVMVARGDLGIDYPLEDVPHLQKHIIRHCVEEATPVITATQMLESMVHAPTPTRAEVSDVANAVFDGTDAVMLSAETAIGRDPARVVATMSRIAARAEGEASYRQWANRLGRLQHRQSLDVHERITDSITHAAWQAADDVGAAAILCCTRTGRTARAMARFRPHARLLGLSPNRRTLDALALSWGVESVEIGESSSTDEMVGIAVETAVSGGYVASGDKVVVIAGAPDRLRDAAADVMRIIQVP
jgi:pyruvate kinase